MNEAVENPCRQDCERRCAGCHAACPDYIRYADYKRDVYAIRAKVSSRRGATPGRIAAMRKASRDRDSGYRHK